MAENISLYKNDLNKTILSSEEPDQDTTNNNGSSEDLQDEICQLPYCPRCGIISRSSSRLSDRSPVIKEEEEYNLLSMIKTEDQNDEDLKTRQIRRSKTQESVYDSVFSKKQVDISKKQLTLKSRSRSVSGNTFKKMIHTDVSENSAELIKQLSLTVDLKEPECIMKLSQRRYHEMFGKDNNKNPVN